jgi:O-antigen/teichoic acid export membrane protein
MNLFRNLLQLIGIDGAIGYTLLARIIQGGGGLIILALIALFLTQEQQGYYYTFGSIIAIQVFFELGFNGIITQYVAHETANLHWVSEVKLFGSDKQLSRVSSLLHFCIKTFGLTSIILFAVLSLSGYIFFSIYHKGDELIHWQFPWLLVSFSTSLMFFMTPILAFFEGLGKVKEIAKIRLQQQSINIIGIAIMFVLKGNLYALGVGTLMSFFIIIGNIIFSNKIKILTNIYKQIGGWKVSYVNEIFPYQWKISLSWISGYFIFQLFNPVLFATEGAIVAGRMGMTLQALNGISSLSMSWITTKIPTFSSLIASKQFTQLDNLFNTTLKQVSCVNVFLILVFLVFIYILILMNIPFASRFLNGIPLLLLCTVTLANQFIFSWATYLRCHKKEPFLINSIVGGILCAISTLVLGRYWGLMGIVYGYSAITLLMGIPWGYYLFVTKKNEWHTTSITL